MLVGVVVDKVFIAGGFNGQECLNTAECFDPKTRQWTMIAPMRNRRSGIGVIAHDGFVYAVGGFNGITRMNNGEKYNPVTNSWSNITEMYSPRSNFGIEVRNRRYRRRTTHECHSHVNRRKRKVFPQL